MSTGIIVLIVVIVIVVLLVAVFAGSYNGLVKLNERVNEAWSDITVQLKYRADLIPNIVETVKGYAKHESETFEMVTNARSAVMGAKTVKESAAAEKEMQGALGRILAIAESYPELKASANFQTLQSQLQDTEDKMGKSNEKAAKVYVEHLNMLYATYDKIEQDPLKWNNAQKDAILKVFDEGSEIPGITNNPNWIKRTSTMELLKNPPDVEEEVKTESTTEAETTEASDGEGE